LEILREFLTETPPAHHDRARWGELLRSGRPADLPDPTVDTPTVSSGT
jgi:hypothetical protein